MTLVGSKLPKIHWMQAGGQALVLLVGVLLALAGQAWWEHLEERETIGEYASNLSLEVSANHQELKAVIERHAKYVGAGKALLWGMQGESSPDSMAAALKNIATLGFFSDFRPATSSLENLVGAGGLGLLESTELQLGISSYAQGIEDHNALQRELSEFFHQHYVPYLSARTPLLELGYLSTFEGLPQKSKFPIDTNVLLDSLAFENLVVRRLVAEIDAKHYAERLLKETGEVMRLLKEFQI